MSARKLTSKLSCWKIFDIFTFSSLAGLVFIWQQNTHKLTVNLYFHFWDLEKKRKQIPYSKKYNRKSKTIKYNNFSVCIKSHIFMVDNETGH